MTPRHCVPNPFGRHGFVLGWEPAFLGNCLTALANLVAFSIRSAVPVIFPQIDDYRDLFADPGRTRSIFDPGGRLDPVRAGALVQDVAPVFEGYFPAYTGRIATVAPHELSQYPDACGTTLFLPYTTTQQIVDWSEGGVEQAVAQFCHQGAGLVLPGAFWTQYVDMREAATYGPALRDHIGALRPDGHAARVAHMASHKGTLRIAVHVRQGDYRHWHNGRYYYELSEYIAFMHRMHAQLSGVDHQFYVFSNTAFDAGQFAPLPVFCVPGDSLDDFATIGRCDVVVGPPSTFATWSAFLGHAKRLVLDRDRLDARDESLGIMDWAVDVPFPTGAYLPGDPAGHPI